MIFWSFIYLLLYELARFIYHDKYTESGEMVKRYLGRKSKLVARKEGRCAERASAEKKREALKEKPLGKRLFFFLVPKAGLEPA